MRVADPVTLEEALAQACDRLTEGCATPRDVAVKLTAARCPGQRGHPRKCPLAKWFTVTLRAQGMLPRRRAVCVDGTTWGRKYLYLHVEGRTGRRAGLCAPVPVPPLLVQFAGMFDSGGFAGLST
jgi:hypothetical protein